MATLKVETQPNSPLMTSIVTINAPLEKVFEAYTNVDLFKQWYARGNEMIIHEFNAIDGGRWHIAEVADGTEYGFSGSFHEVALNERIVQTFEFLGNSERGHVSLEKAEFIKINENTTEVRAVGAFLSVKEKEDMISAGMEAGYRESVEALGKLIEGDK